MIFLENLEATEAFGQQLANCLESGVNIYLHGDLGAGKTTLVRGLVQAVIPGARVKSPTYTLVEDYPLANTEKPVSHIYHFDLYRMGDPEELEYLGGRDYFAGDAICLVEWPQRGEGWLPKADLELTLHYSAQGRHLEILANTEKGQQLASQIQK